MAVINGLQSKSIKKYVLQQSNCNLDVSHEDHKPLEKTPFPSRGKESALETENQRSPSLKSDAKRLRSVRLELSSLKRGLGGRKGSSRGQEGGSSTEESSDEGGGGGGGETVQGKRKPRPVVPNYVTNTESGPCRRPRQNRQDVPSSLSSQTSPKSASQSLSIARRNARERNRVKQVNEGFATLRSRIPDYISEAYNEEKGRKSAKKLSKVETLRMAVDYIRHLETLLDLRSTTEGWPKGRQEEEERPWETPHSGGEYLSPFGETGFEYQERIFYEYEVEKGPGRKEPAGPFPGLNLENQCVEEEEEEEEEELKYYETFNRIKKDGGGEGEDAEGCSPPPHHHLLPKDVIEKAPKKGGVLPPITESFNKTIPVFF